MADPGQRPDDTSTPEHDDAHINNGGGDVGTDGGATPPPPQDPADPLSEPHLKSLAEHIARFLAGSDSRASGGPSSAAAGK